MTESVRILSRAQDGRAAGPVRIVHLGVGNFFRAHQAWYTEHAPDAADWGIAAFAGRSGPIAAELAARDGLYTLIVRAADGDHPEVISALSTVSADLNDWRRCFSSPELALVTTTVTEAGYRRTEEGSRLNRDDADVAADIGALKQHGVDAEVSTAPGKLVLGLAVRRAHELPGIAIVPCDNVPNNGALVARVVGELAGATDPTLASWITHNVTFVTTMVDRITPQTTDELEPTDVVTEPFTEWVLSGEFPQGRPRWEDVGARFVADIEPWENRKLWLLNGSHSLLAYAGTIRGHDTVAEAIADPTVRGWVEEWWDVAGQHLSLSDEDIASYREALVTRYQNPQIRHLLRQIAADGSQKIPIRILPTVRAELARGRVPVGAARVLAAWICHLRGLGAPINDVAAEEYSTLATGDLDEAVGTVLSRLNVDDEDLCRAVTDLAHELGG